MVSATWTASAVVLGAASLGAALEDAVGLPGAAWRSVPARLLQWATRLSRQSHAAPG